MKTKTIWLVVSCLVAVAMLLVSCTPAVIQEEEETTAPSATEQEVVTEGEEEAITEEEAVTEEEENTEQPQKPDTPPGIPPPEETTLPPTQPEEEQIIGDLAYIKIYSSSYTDDADPEHEGVSINVFYYDSKSEFIIIVQDVLVTVAIKLYGYKLYGYTSEVGGVERELVYQEQVTIEARGLDAEAIRIPYENIEVDQNRYSKWGDMEVMFTTPQQGSFQATTRLVRLYSEQVVQEQDLSLEIVSVSSPIRQGYTATLQAITAPGADCTIAVYYESGRSSASGLYPKEADNQGNVAWSWKVDTGTTPRSWQIVVRASLDGDTVSQTTNFTVY